LKKLVPKMPSSKPTSPGASYRGRVSPLSAKNSARSPFKSPRVEPLGVAFVETDTAAYAKDVQKFIYDIRRRKIRGSRFTATATVDLLTTVMSKVKWTTAQEVLNHIIAVSKQITKARVNELCIGNISKRILHIIRQEFARHVRGVESLDKLINPSILDAFSIKKVDFNKKINDSLKSEIFAAILELRNEIDIVHEQIAGQAKDHIHSDEIVLTLGHSETVLAFLRAAAETPRRFKVIVAEGSPSNSGHRMALELAKVKDTNGKNPIETTVITDSAIFAIMSRVNKVVVGTHAVLASGGLLSNSGVFAMALAAKQHKVPVVVVTGLYKLAPTYFPQDTQVEYGNPRAILPYESRIIDKVSVFNPELDYIPPDLVSIYIMDVGGHSPSYIYRILKEYYTVGDE